MLFVCMCGYVWLCVCMCPPQVIKKHLREMKPVQPVKHAKLYMHKKFKI